MLFQSAGAHEQPDVAAGNGFLSDAIFRRPDVFRGVEHLFRRRDVVGRAGEQIGRTGDAAQIEFSPQADELALGQTVLHEQLFDHLKIPAAW